MIIRPSDIVLVVDGERAALFHLEANGWEHLREIWQMQRKEALDSAFGKDRPGRYQSSPQTPKSAFEKSSKHDAHSSRFLQDVAAKLDELLKETGSQIRLAVVAPPETMGVLRGLFSEMVRNRIVKELLHDYTRTPHDRLEQLIRKSL
jgi:protein required for attachment to host cells